jgi:hypothetical protein
MWSLIKLHIADFKSVVTSVSDIDMFVLFSRCAISFLRSSSPFTSRNQPKCNHSIYNYMRLDLGIFATTRPNFNYFGHSHNYDATIKIFILLVGSSLHLFPSINRLVCPINRSSHQISYILKVFYNDIRVYFNVCTKIIYIYAYVCILFI